MIGHAGAGAGAGARVARGSLAGIALFGLVAHVLLQVGWRIESFWLPACLAAGLTAACAARRGIATAAPPGSDAPPPRWLVPAAISVLALVLVMLVYGSVATPAREWDGTISWEMRATVLAAEPTIEQVYFREPAVFAHSRAYPLLQPLCLASLFRLLGADAGRILFPALWVLMLALAGLAWRRAGVTRALSWLLVLAFGLTPMLSNPTMGSVDSGFAELFVALCVTALAAGLLCDDLVLLGLGTFLMALAKPEGTFYPLLAAGAVWATSAPRPRSRAQLRVILGAWAAAVTLWLPVHFSLLGRGPGLVPVAVGAASVVVAGLLSHVWLTRRSRHPLAPVVFLSVVPLAAAAVLWLCQPAFEGHTGVLVHYLTGIDRAIERVSRVPEIVLHIGVHLLFVRKFGFVFALLIVLAVLPRRHFGRCPNRTLGLLLAFGGLFLIAPFLLSPETDLRHHVRSSMDRLLVHWVGAAWLLLGVWLQRVLATGSNRFAASVGSLASQSSPVLGPDVDPTPQRPNTSS